MSRSRGQRPGRRVAQPHLAQVDEQHPIFTSVPATVQPTAADHPIPPVYAHPAPIPYDPLSIYYPASHPAPYIVGPATPLPYLLPSPVPALVYPSVSHIPHVYTPAIPVHIALPSHPYMSIPNPPFPPQYVLPQVAAPLPEAPHVRFPASQASSVGGRSSRASLPRLRSEWVMWVGNVPTDASEEELWRFFCQMNPHQTNNGLLSVHAMPKSNCAFVNYDSKANLDVAVASFDGRSCRPDDLGCPALVCRVRARDDGRRGGVNSQHRLHLHQSWVRDHPKPNVAADNPQPDSRIQTPTEGHRITSPAKPLVEGSDDDRSSISSFLTEHFPIRYFILKSFTPADLHTSVDRGLWATQAHNETLLDQAFRTSEQVYLIFGANKSREFFGYAKMIGPIFSDGDEGSGEAGPSQRRSALSSSSARSRVASSSSTLANPFLEPGDLSGSKSSPSTPDGSVPSRPQRTTFKRFTSLDSGQASTSTSSPASAPSASPGRSAKETQQDTPKVWLASSRAFKVEWIRIQRLSFQRTRHIRNPWNEDLEVKLSRDGTELEPSAGKFLLEQWDNIPTQSDRSQGRTSST